MIPLNRQADAVELALQGKRAAIARHGPKWPPHDTELAETRCEELEAAVRTLRWLIANADAVKRAAQEPRDAVNV